MGVNLSWVAVQGGQKAAVLQQQGLEEIGESSDEFGAKYACAETPQGWLILTSSDLKFDLTSTLARLSSGALCLGCEVYESPMVSGARAVRDGETLWSIDHNPEKGVAHLEVNSEPPPPFAEIRARLEANQAAPDSEGVDYIFDAPGELAESICGYRAGQMGSLEWTLLQPAGSGRQVAAPRSISSAIRSELLPLLQSQGWSFASDRPHLAQPEQITRRLDGREQTVCFYFASGPRTYITVYLWDIDAQTPGSKHVVRARVQDPPDRRPLFKRLLGRPAPPAAPADPIDAVIEKAKTHIAAAEAFFRTRQPSEQIHVEFSQVVADPEA